MRRKIARLFRLAARYTESPKALAVRRNGGTSETFWKLDHTWFHDLGLRGVIDVGTNEGQFSRTMRALLPKAQIFAFEPIPECFGRTKEKFANDPLFKLFNCALGDKNAETEFSVSADTGASSVLPMSSTQAHHFPQSLKRHSIKVQIEKLDDIIATQSLPAPYLLKIDVQGFEFQVLQGGMATLAGASLVILEASFEPFYEGQKLFDEVYDLLRGNGFQFRDSFNIMHDQRTGKALQGDFLFVKAL